MAVFGTYTYFANSTQEEIDLTNSILKDINLSNKDELLGVTDSVLKLPFNNQLQFVHCVVDTLYTLSEENDEVIKTQDNIAKFLGQEEFKNHRDIILTIIDEYITDEERSEKISEYKNMFNINIIDSKE